MPGRTARAPRPDPLPAPSGARDPDGEVAEWSKAPHSKCGVRATVPWVRIPPSPPILSTTQPRHCSAGVGGVERDVPKSDRTFDIAFPVNGQLEWAALKVVTLDMGRAAAIGGLPIVADQVGHVLPSGVNGGVGPHLYGGRAERDRYN